MFNVGTENRLGFDGKLILTIPWLPGTCNALVTSVPNFIRIGQCIAELLIIQQIFSAHFAWAVL